MLSYLESCITRKEGEAASKNPTSNEVRCARRRLSQWRSHYLTMQIAYDSVEAMKDWFMDPKIYALLDYAWMGRGVCKTHQFTLGVELHF